MGVEMGQWCRAEETEVMDDKCRRNALLLRVDGNDIQHGFGETVDEETKADGRMGKKRLWRRASATKIKADECV